MKVIRNMVFQNVRSGLNYEKRCIQNYSRVSKIICVFLATHIPKQAMDFWFSYYNKTEGVMSLFAIDNSVSIKEYMLINRYLVTQWQRLYIIYCK